MIALLGKNPIRAGGRLTMGNKKLRHEIVFRSMVRIRCKCGWLWRNDRLRGKADDEIQNETDGEFYYHWKAMRDQGFA